MKRTIAGVPAWRVGALTAAVSAGAFGVLMVRTRCEGPRWLGVIVILGVPSVVGIAVAAVITPPWRWKAARALARVATAALVALGSLYILFGLAWSTCA